LNITESDESNYFAYSATLRILGENLDFERITKGIGVRPTETVHKGEKRGTRPILHDLWMFSPDVSEERPLSEHIDTLWIQIQPAQEYLLSLKEEATVNVFLGYRSNCDHAGVEVPHSSLEMFVALKIPFGISIIVT